MQLSKYILYTIKHSLHKILHWEYWPQWLVYAPIIPVYLYYAVKSKSLHFHITTNPFIENGGYLMESKYQLYHAFPKNVQPITICINKEMNALQMENNLQAAGIVFPCVAKPNIGGKGLGVKIVNSMQDVWQYHQQIPIPYLLQQKIHFTNEVGIFYCRYPTATKGFISGIVEKKPMVVKGNGVATLQQLVYKKARYYFQRHYLQQEHAAIWNSIVPTNKTIVLSTIGNHARGSLFENASYKKTETLENIINQLSTQTTPFFYGRFDIMFNSWDELNEGNNFLIVEVNGSGSEPTHIYHPTHTLYQAWKIIVQHWQYAYTIAKQQIALGHKYTPYSTVQQWQKEYASLVKTIKKKYNIVCKVAHPISYTL
jgi:hypothetical protein